MSITGLGTLAVFGLDHMGQWWFYQNRSTRHECAPSIDLPMAVGIALAMVVTLGFFSGPDLVWLITLALGGSLYVAITVNRVAAPRGAKEVLGAILFTAVVWGRVAQPPILALLGFFGLAASNFLWSSYFDRIRDAYNHHITSASASSSHVIGLARGCALVALLLMAPHAPALAPFIVVACAHLCWSKRGPHIDLAFALLVVACWF